MNVQLPRFYIKAGAIVFTTKNNLNKISVYPHLGIFSIMRIKIIKVNIFYAVIFSYIGSGISLEYGRKTDNNEKTK